MKIIFMGTPDFAVPCLEKLINSEHEIVAVFTQSDKKKGRGYTLTAPPRYRGIIFPPRAISSPERTETRKAN